MKLDEHVNPGKAVADYRTDITGISATDLKGITCSLADVQVLFGWPTSFWGLLVYLIFLVHFVEIHEDAVVQGNYISWPQFK